ncbi:Sulfate/thiosulfate import ATP-binding protein CysA [compost metagenome]
MRVEIRRIQQELGITTVYVSHDQEECFSISDQVAVMNNGKIEQLDKPSAIFKYPASEFVARFIGFGNFIAFDGRNDMGSDIELSRGALKFLAAKRPEGLGNKGLLGAIRPDDLQLFAASPEPGTASNTLPGTVQISTYLGRSYQYQVETELGVFTVNQEMEQPFVQGQQVTVYFPKEKLVLVQ